MTTVAGVEVLESTDTFAELARLRRRIADLERENWSLRNTSREAAQNGALNDLRTVVQGLQRRLELVEHTLEQHGPPPHADDLARLAAYAA